MNWWKDLKGKVRLKELLKNHTTFKIGGPVKFFIEPRDINDLKLLLNLVNPALSTAKRNCKIRKGGVKIYLPAGRQGKMPLLVIGAGSNILINDKGVDGVVLRLNSPYFKRVSFRNNCLDVGSGARLSQVVLSAQKRGLSGAEFLVGIPGTVGGALVMNAGVSGKSIGDLVENVTVMDYNGSIKILNKKDIKFGYRVSSLSKYIILSARIKLVKADKEEIRGRVKRYLGYRKITQGLSLPNAGCIFKNPQGYSAGRLIDLCGLKGKRIKDACVSERHANFILNLGRAKSEDVIGLMKLIQREVKNKFNINLKPEIKIWQ